MAILSQCLIFESVNELDADFRVPNLNNFAKRIGEDAKVIQLGLAKQGRWNIVPSDSLEEYSAEIYRVIDIISGLDIKLIREFADYLKETFKEI